LYSPLDRENLFFIESYFCIQDKLHLAVDNHGANDQNNGGGKLKNNHATSQLRTLASTAYASLQDVHRFERRQVKGGINSSQQANDNGGNY